MFCCTYLVSSLLIIFCVGSPTGPTTDLPVANSPSPTVTHFYDSEYEVDLDSRVAADSKGNSFSEVTAWGVDMQAATAMLEVTSYIPSEEKGIWYISFTSKVRELAHFADGFGTVTSLDGPKSDRWCSNRPDFTGLPIVAVATSDIAYTEGEAGHPLSIFNWRTVLPSVRREGELYRVVREKAFPIDLKVLLNCGDAARSAWSVTNSKSQVTYKGTLFQTYIKLKDNCTTYPTFSMSKCAVYTEISTLLIWRLNTFIVVNGFLQSNKIVGPIWPIIEAGVTGTSIQHSHADNEQLGSVSTVNANVSMTMSLHDNTGMFVYVKGSFNVSNQDVVKWRLLEAPDAPEFTQYFNKSRPLSEQYLPRELFPSFNNTQTQFNFLVEVTFKPQDMGLALAVAQQYMFISCDVEYCTTNRSYTTVTTNIALGSFSSGTSKSSAGFIAELRWTVRVLSAAAPDGVSVLPGSARPLYALEPLTIVLALSPVFVLRQHSLHLMFVGLCPGLRVELCDTVTVLQRDETVGERELPNQIIRGYRVQGVASFDCSDEGLCDLRMRSVAFAEQPSGTYTMFLGLVLRVRDRVKRDQEPQMISLSTDQAKLHLALNLTSSSHCMQVSRLTVLLITALTVCKSH